MEKQVFAVGESPRIIIETNGSLVLKGDDALEVVIRTDSAQNVEVEASEEEVRIKGKGDLTIKAPRLSSIQLIRVGSQAIVKGLEGPLAAEDVRGSLILRDMGEVEIGRVRGDLVAKRVEGNLTLRRIDGNASIRNLDEDFQVEEVIAGNLSLDAVEGNVEASVNGNATMRVDPASGKNYDIRARGNVLIRLPGDASLEVDIIRAGNIRIKLKSVQVADSIRAPYQFVVGDGDASMRLEANGIVSLVQRAPDWEMMDAFDTDFKVEMEGAAEEIGRQVTEQMEAQLNFIQSQIDEQLASLSETLGTVGLSPEAAERISQRAREASARATARAQEKMARAREKINRKMEAAQRRAEQKARAAEPYMQRYVQKKEARSGGGGWTKPAPPSDPVTEQERLLVLQMLGEKKITLEEAESLLDALEGDKG
jgi:hypothetical protein